MVTLSLAGRPLARVCGSFGLLSTSRVASNCAARVRRANATPYIGEQGVTKGCRRLMREEKEAGQRRAIEEGAMTADMLNLTDTLKRFGLV